MTPGIAYTEPLVKRMIPDIWMVLTCVHSLFHRRALSPAPAGTGTCTETMTSLLLIQEREHALRQWALILLLSPQRPVHDRTLDTGEGTLDAGNWILDTGRWTRRWPPSDSGPILAVSVLLSRQPYIFYAESWSTWYKYCNQELWTFIFPIRPRAYVTSTGISSQYTSRLMTAPGLISRRLEKIGLEDACAHEWALPRAASLLTTSNSMKVSAEESESESQWAAEWHGKRVCLQLAWDWHYLITTSDTILWRFSNRTAWYR